MTCVPDRSTRLPFSRPDLRLLDAVGQCGDLTEVARRVGLRHGAVERQLGRLDRAVGLPLTLRSRHTARLTSAGSRMLAAGRRFFRQVDLAVQTSIFGCGTEAVVAPRILAIASAEPTLDDLVEDAAAGLGVLLSVHHEAPHRVVQQLAGYHVDAAHTWSLDSPHDSVDRSVRVYDVLDDPLWVTLPLGHPLAAREAVSLADLAEENWVSETGPNSEVLVARVFQGAGLPVPARLHVTGASVARGMMRCGDAVGFGSPAWPAVLAPSVVHRPVVERPHRSTGLIVDPTIVPGRLAEQLALMLAERCLNRFAEHCGDLLRDPWWADWHRTRRRERDAKARSASAPRRDVGPSPAPAEAGKLDVEDLHLLRAVAKHGSINRAATVLSISQSALTRRIHRLERRLGARLLLRSSRGTDLTSPARRFLRQLTDFENEFHEVKASCRNIGPVAPGRPWQPYLGASGGDARARGAGAG